MNDIVPQTPVNFPAAPNRRAVLAFLALADAPDIMRISFRDDNRLHLQMDSVAATVAWCRLLGFPEPTDTRQNPGWWNSSGTIAGWSIYVAADETAPHISEPVDTETREQLQQLLDPPDGAS